MAEYLQCIGRQISSMTCWPIVMPHLNGCTAVQRQRFEAFCLCCALCIKRGFQRTVMPCHQFLLAPQRTIACFPFAAAGTDLGAPMMQVLLNAGPAVGWGGWGWVGVGWGWGGSTYRSCDFTNEKSQLVRADTSHQQQAAVEAKLRPSAALLTSLLHRNLHPFMSYMSHRINHEPATRTSQYAGTACHSSPTCILTSFFMRCSMMRAESASFFVSVLKALARCSVLSRYALCACSKWRSKSSMMDSSCIFRTLYSSLFRFLTCGMTVGSSTTCWNVMPGQCDVGHAAMPL